MERINRFLAVFAIFFILTIAMFCLLNFVVLCLGFLFLSPLKGFCFSIIAFAVIYGLTKIKDL